MKFCYRFLLEMIETILKSIIYSYKDKIYKTES